MDYKINDSVKAKLKRFITDAEVFECFDNLFKAARQEEGNKITALLDTKELPDDKVLREMSYNKGRLDMLKKITNYLYFWKGGIKYSEKKKEDKKNEK